MTTKVKARVALIYLPVGEGGAKQGVDDYLAAGHTTNDLLALSTHELREPPREERPERSCPYRETSGGPCGTSIRRTAPCRHPSLTSRPGSPVM
jgi:hypothetical protein